MNISAIMRKPGALYTCLTGIITANKSSIRQFMRVNVVIILITLTTFQALLATSTKGQDMHTDKVTVGLRDENLISGIKKIEQQTSLRFYYRKADIKMLTGLNLPAGTRTVEQTLSELLQNTFFSFRQIGDNILLERNDHQTGYQVQGRVTDIHHKAVEFVTVSVQKSADHQQIQTAQTDTGGHFQFTIREKGDYLISISAPGMDS
ncbi:MAG TPA: carboxypeptidase-like regulatory domain-containing protein, partial [Pedobacter sp.]